MKKILFTVVFLLLVTPAEAAYLDIAWDSNSEPDLAGYWIYYGTESRNYTNSVDVGNVTTYHLDNLSEGVTYYIAATAYDTSDNESDFSEEVSGMSLPDNDTDGDGLPDDWEINYFGNLGQGPDGDYDGDGLNNMAEYQQGTDPTDTDTDSDQMPDGWEIQYGLDPLDPSDADGDIDGDGLTNLEEYLGGTDPTNAPPTASAGPDQTVDEGTMVTLDGSNSSDPDDGIASYQWEQTSGPAVVLSSATAVQPTFTAPNGGPSGASLTFQLTVTDHGGLESTDTCIVNVSRENLPPTANAGPDQTVDEGVTVVLDGSNSSDPDDGIASYLWEQSSGIPVTLSDPTAVQPTFASPDVGTSGASLTFRLTVSDYGGLQSADSCVVNITWVNTPPTANAGPDQTAVENTTVGLDGSNSSDRDDGIASYAWEQTAGLPVTLSDPRSVRPSFTSPYLEGDGASLTFQLTVSDHGGLESTDTCIVNVTQENLPPTADAGADQTVDEGVEVTLDGSNSSDPEGSIGSHLWEQTAGPSVTLSDPTSVGPTFTSPNVNRHGKSLSFRLTVTDRAGLKSTDTCIANVTWVNGPPWASVGKNKKKNASEGDTVTLDASTSSDPDDGIASFLWEQNSGTPITLSDPRAVSATFVAPAVKSSETLLFFQVTVTDRGGLQSSDEISVTIEDNGITGFPDDVITFTASTGENLGIKVMGGGSCVNLSALDPSAITDNRNRPDDLIYGLIETQFKVDAIGGTVVVTFYLPDPAPQGYGWYKYSPTMGWYDYSDHAVFNSTRDQVTVTLVDGGMGDDDGVANGMIVDPSVLGSTPAGEVAPSPQSDTNVLRGCFISTVSQPSIGK